MDNKKTVLIENDKYANKVMMSVLCASGAALIVVWILLEAGVLSMENGIPRIPIITCLLMMIAAEFLCVHYKYNKRWIKYFLMGVLIVAYGVLYATFTYTVSILMVIPIVMSSRYFSQKYTIIVSLITFIAFWLAEIWGANHGMFDLNYLMLPKGTVIEITGDAWLSSFVSGIPYDKGLMIKNVITYSYAFKLLLSLVVAIASMAVASQGRKMVLKQQALTEESVGLSTELAVASKIQQSMLPNTFPAFPKRHEFDLYASMTPALLVGGDFYDFFLVDEDHLAVIMADVSDKGVPAALFAALSKNTIANNVMQGKSPAKAITDANDTLCENNTENMFVTVWLGLLEISTGLLTVCNAGHEPPILMRHDEDYMVYRDMHGFAMGCVKEADYEEYNLRLRPGDRIFLYTDGVPDATNEALERMGIDGVVGALNMDLKATPWQMLLNVQSRIDDFVQKAEQFDDMTMLALEYKGNN